MGKSSSSINITKKIMKKLSFSLLVFIIRSNENEAFIPKLTPSVEPYVMRFFFKNTMRTKPMLLSLPVPENEASSYNDAFLDTLENVGGGSNNKSNLERARSLLGGSSGNTSSDESNDNSSIDPSPDSLAALRDIATTNVANFLAAFSHPPEGSTESGESIDTPGNDGDKKDSINQNRNGELSSGDGSIVDSVTGFPSTPQANQEPKKIHWDVYVCQSKQCIERGASATLDSFQALVPNEPITTNGDEISSSSSSSSSSGSGSSSSSSSSSSINPYQSNTVTTIDIHPAILSRSKAKGPNVRCIQRTPPYTSFEVNNVNDIDKVYRILTKHMSIMNISMQAKECLKYTYQGNSHLEKNELSDAIRSYNTALEQGYKSQEGMLLLLRATAYLKRAFQHQEILRETVADLGGTVADPMALGKLYSIAGSNPSLAKGIFQKVTADTKAQDKKFRQTKYRHGLYEYSLLHAAQDSLRATQLLPHHAKTWLRAGDALAELRKLKESALYYEKAMELDPTLRGRLEPVIERLNRSQEFLDRARGWWSSDTLRLALDVAG